MPYYIFESPSGEVKEIFQHMNDDHSYSENGETWRRIFINPQAAIDTKWNHNDPKDFARKSGSKKGTIGDLWSKSAELSEKRKKERGVDPVKEKMYKDYSKSRNGTQHPDRRKEKLNEILSKPIDIKIKK